MKIDFDRRETEKDAAAQKLRDAMFSFLLERFTEEMNSYDYNFFMYSGQATVFPLMELKQMMLNAISDFSKESIIHKNTDEVLAVDSYLCIQAVARLARNKLFLQKELRSLAND